MSRSKETGEKGKETLGSQSGGSIKDKASSSKSSAVASNEEYLNNSTSPGCTSSELNSTYAAFYKNPLDPVNVTVETKLPQGDSIKLEDQSPYVYCCFCPVAGFIRYCGPNKFARALGPNEQLTAGLAIQLCLGSIAAVISVIILNKYGSINPAYEPLFKSIISISVVVGLLGCAMLSLMCVRYQRAVASHNRYILARTTQIFVSNLANKKMSETGETKKAVNTIASRHSASIQIEPPTQVCMENKDQLPEIKTVDVSERVTPATSDENIIGHLRRNKSDMTFTREPNSWHYERRSTPDEIQTTSHPNPYSQPIPNSNIELANNEQKLKQRVYYQKKHSDTMSSTEEEMNAYSIKHSNSESDEYLLCAPKKVPEKVLVTLNKLSPTEYPEHYQISQNNDRNFIQEDKSLTCGRLLNEKVYHSALLGSEVNYHESMSLKVPNSSRERQRNRQRQYRMTEARSWNEDDSALQQHKQHCSHPNRYGLHTSVSQRPL